MKTQANAGPPNKLSPFSTRTLAGSPRLRPWGIPALLWLGLLFAPYLADAQIVADGATNTLSNVTTNITGDVTVGTNGSFTLLILSDNALLTNSVNGLIGRNAGANSNEVRLISASARWFMGGSLFVGNNGAANRLVVSNGATVLARSSSTIGYGGDFSGNANSNTVTVSGAGSLWSNGLELVVGEIGVANRLEVNNGGRVLNSNAFVGRSFFSPSNTVVVTGTGSLWSNRTDLILGGSGNGNLLVVSNGGWVVNSNASVGLQSAGNLALVTGVSSTWSNRADLYVGNGARENQLVVSEGAVVVDNNGILGNSATSSNNLVLVTGGGSVWSNRSDLTIGTFGRNNQLIVSNGAVAADVDGFLGHGPGASNNVALVTGVGSLWTNSDSLLVGYQEGRNQLVVSNGGVVANGIGYLGYFSSANNNVAVVTDAGSVWSNRLNLNVGFDGAGNQLVVTNGGRVLGSMNGVIGYNSFSSNNAVLVTGINSCWSNFFNVNVGLFGAGNRLVVEKSGKVVSDAAYIGGFGSGNEAVVTDAGSVWSNVNELVVGDSNGGNRLVVTNGAVVQNTDGTVGFSNPGGSNNVALVTGPGSLWSNANDLSIGRFGSGNLLVVSNGATVVASNVFVSSSTVAFNNRLVVDGGTLRAVNTVTNGTLTVQRGTNVLSSGSIEADQLLLVRNGTTVTPGVFGNSSSITIPTGSTASQYPSTIAVASLAGVITKVTVTLSNLSHTFPADIDILLVSPAGQKVMLMSDVGDGAGTDLTNVKYIFDDAAGSLLSANAPSGTYRPNDITPGETMPGPAPAGPYSVTLSSFNGSSPNGTWRLYIADDANPDSGSLVGWGLRITTEPDRGFFEFNGGLLVTRGAVISNDAPFQVGASGTRPATWDVRAGLTDHVLTDNLTIGNGTSFNLLLVTNGASLGIGNDASIGVNSTAKSNTIIIAGPGSHCTVGDILSVGSNAPLNRLVVSNGASLFASFGYVGNKLGSRSNLALITGSGSVWSNAFDLIVGIFDADNRLEISDGAIAYSEFGFLGFNAGSSNNFSLVTGSGSMWSSSADLFVGRAGAGSLLVVSNGALVTVGGGVFVGNNPGSTNSRVIVDGGTLRSTNLAGTGALDIRRGTNLLNAGLIETDILRLTNTLSRFEFKGGTLSVKSSRAGDTFTVGNGVSAAALILAGNGTHDFSAGAPGLVVSSNATLTGNGSLGGILIVQSGGKLVPGTSVGKMVFTNPPSLQGAIVMEISKSGSTVTNDQVQVITGTLTYGGTLTVSNLGPTALAAGDRFQLFSAGTYAGSFASLSLPPLGPRLEWINKLSVDGSIEVSAPPAIPISSGSYTQDFSSLASSGSANLWRDNSTLLGWYAAKSVPPAPITTYRASDGSDNTGALYSFGSTGSGDRALGSIASDSVGIISYGLSFSNDTGVSVTDFAINYTGEQWRNGDLAVTNTLTFWYRVSASALTNPEPGIVTNWTQVTGLSFVSPTVLTNGTPLNGNQTTNRQTFSTVLVSGLVVPAGQNVFFRWRDLNDSGADQGMAVDDLVVTFLELPPDKFWTNGLGGTYHDPLNWLAQAVAGPEDTANFTNVTSYQVNWSADALAVNAYFKGRNSTVTQAIGSFSWTLTNSYVVDSGDLVVPAFVRHTSGSLQVTNATGSARLVMGGVGLGSYEQVGGEVVADNLLLTNGSSSFGLHGGTLRTRNLSAPSGFIVGDGVSSATLELLGNGTHNVGSGIFVQSNSVLKGNGAVIGDVSMEGVLSPGSSIGQLVINGVLSMQSGCTNYFEINKAAGTNDSVVGLSNVFYTGTLIVTNLAGTLTNGDKFQLFGAAKYAHSSFNPLILPPLAPGLKWRNELILDGSLEVIPLPTRDFGEDVSHFQAATGISQASWNQMFADGKRFAFIKATEGLTGPHDAAMSNNVVRATAAGLLAGVYHFAHPENRPTTNGAILEASNMVVYAGSAIGPGRLRPVLDVEFSAGMLSTAALTDWVIAFSNEIIAQRGSNAAPIIYCNQIFANFEFDSRLATYDLWLRTVGSGADPAFDDPPGQSVSFATGVFNEWSFWQYSDTGSSGGISPLDLDVCHSEYKPLTSYIIPGSAPTAIELTGVMLAGGGALQFSFANTPGAVFTVLAATNVTTPLANWIPLGPVTEVSPGQFQFTDLQSTNHPKRFYRVRSP